MNNEVQQWFTFAQKDLAVAKHLRDTFYPEPMEIICYHCQQAAEKAIKGAYVFLTEDTLDLNRVPVPGVIVDSAVQENALILLTRIDQKTARIHIVTLEED